MSYSDLITFLKNTNFQPSDIHPEKAFDELITHIKREIKFPKALVTAIKTFGFHKTLNWRQPQTAIADFVDFLEANREFLEKVYSSGRFLTFPSEYSFESVAKYVIENAFRMLRFAKVKDPENHIYLDCYEYNHRTAKILIHGILKNEIDITKLKWISKSVLIAVPISKRQKHVIIVNASERIWNIPSLWVKNKLKLFKKVERRAYENKGCNLHPTERAERTYILTGKYANWICKAVADKRSSKRYVKTFKRLGLFSSAKKALYIYNGRKGSIGRGKGFFSFDYMDLLWKHIYKFYRIRIDRLVEKTNGKPFGRALEIFNNLKQYLDYLNLINAACPA